MTPILFFLISPGRLITLECSPPPKDAGDERFGRERKMYISFFFPNKCFVTVILEDSSCGYLGIYSILCDVLQ